MFEKTIKAIQKDTSKTVEMHGDGIKDYENMVHNLNLIIVKKFTSNKFKNLSDSEKRNNVLSLINYLSGSRMHSYLNKEEVCGLVEAMTTKRLNLNTFSDVFTIKLKANHLDDLSVNCFSRQQFMDFLYIWINSQMGHPDLKIDFLNEAVEIIKEHFNYYFYLLKNHDEKELKQIFKKSKKYGAHSLYTEKSNVDIFDKSLNLNDVFSTDVTQKQLDDFAEELLAKTEEENKTTKQKKEKNNTLFGQSEWATPKEPLTDIHTTTGLPIKAKDLIKSSLTVEQYKGFLIGSAIKYRMQAGIVQEPNVDIYKALWYEKQLKH